LRSYIREHSNDVFLSIKELRDIEKPKEVLNQLDLFRESSLLLDLLHIGEGLGHHGDDGVHEHNQNQEGSQHKGQVGNYDIWRRPTFRMVAGGRNPALQEAKLSQTNDIHL